MHRVLTIAAAYSRGAGFDVLPLVDGFEARAGRATMRIAARGLRIDVSFTPRGLAPLRCQIEGLDAVRAFVDGIVELRDGESLAAELVDRLKTLECGSGPSGGKQPLRTGGLVPPGPPAGTIR